MADNNALDAARYRRAAAWGTLIPMVVFGAGAALQSELFQVARGLAAYGEIYSVPLWARLVANLTAAAMVALSVWLIPVNPRRRMVWLSLTLGVMVAAVLVRGGLQLLFGVYPISYLDLVFVDVVVGFL